MKRSTKDRPFCKAVYLAALLVSNGAENREPQLQNKRGKNILKGGIM